MNKKIIISFFALVLSLNAFTQQFNLGKVSFATDSIWAISGNGNFKFGLMRCRRIIVAIRLRLMVAGGERKWTEIA